MDDENSRILKKYRLGQASPEERQIMMIGMMITTG